jgi:hypothetical protein
MIALVETAAGSFAVDLELEEVEPWDGDVVPDPAPPLSLPRVISAAASGSTIVALVATKPPLVVSHDAGVTWRESGRGLPDGVAVALGDDPDLVLFAARNRLYVSRNGGVFWSAIPIELPEIRMISIQIS